jgi:putative acetyltransferase
MTFTIAQEAGDSADALALLRARDEENFELYPPEARFGIAADRHAEDGVVFLIMRENGVSIGCGALQPHDGYAEMKSVFLLPQARGRRLGHRIIEALERAARDLGYDDVRLETGKRSPWALKTYERAGYSICGRFGDYPEEAPLSVFMSKRLAERMFATPGNNVETVHTIEGEQP